MSQQWEYCEMRWQVSQSYNAARPIVVFYRAPGQPWSPPDTLPEQLALRLGLDGWELVSVISHDSTDGLGGPEIRWYFKRAYTNGNGTAKT
jgi:hypothetical protein